MNLTAFLEISHSMDELITKIATPVLILIIGLIVGKIIHKFLDLILYEINVKDMLVRGEVIERGFGSLVANIIYIISITIFLNMMGILKEVLVGALVLLVALIIISLLFFLKDFAPNLAAYFKTSRKKDKKVSVLNITGKIIHQNFYETQVQTNKGDIFAIKNKHLI